MNKLDSQRIKLYTLPSRSKANRTSQNLSISMSLPTLQTEPQKSQLVTLYIANRAFRAYSRFGAFKKVRQAKIYNIEKKIKYKNV